MISDNRRVVASSEEAGLIESSSEQQFAGVDQISSAMSSIGQAVEQNLDGVKQLEGAAKRLEELGTSLKELVQHYKVRDQMLQAFAKPSTFSSVTS